MCKKNKGACVSCQCCKTPGKCSACFRRRLILTYLVHVECAHQAGYILGFDISPIKQGRRDQPNIAVNIGQNSGAMTAGIWCKDHVPTKIVHRMQDIADQLTGINALQLYVQNFKQADLTLTGTVRKATLVNQSTKVLNPQAPTVQAPNRRGSTTTGTNGNVSTGRGSVSNVKTEDVHGDLSSLGKGSPRKICVTCDVDVSPKWWPFPPDPPKEASEPLVDVSMSVDSEQALAKEVPLTNGHAANGVSEDTGGSNVALAAAALHRNPSKLVALPTEFQCHQCHWKKIRKEPTPPPSVPAAPRDSSRPPLDLVQPLQIPTPEPELIQPPPAPFVWPPPPPSYPANPPSYNWPRRSPGPQAVPLVNHMNGSHSPRRNSGSMQSHSGQPQMRQPMHGVPHSPRQNGHMPQGPNGYHPPSPHRSMGSPALHLHNGAYPSYASTRPPPQHLTNGGPPPRAPEHPFSHSHAPMHSRQSYGQPHGSPPMLRESHPQGREPPMNPPTGNSRPNDGRVNGGASASPSLRNLLS